MASVSISGIRKSFGSTAVLKGIDLEVPDGAFLSLVGPSGCGKSTLLRILAGLEPQDQGEIRIGGRGIDHLRPKDRDVAMVFQSYALYAHMTVFDNMALPLVMRRLSPAQRFPLLRQLLPGSAGIRAAIREEVLRVAGLLDIGPLLARKPSQLSGGQRQRVALGRALVRHPQVFLMDEPLSNLDAKLRVHTRTEITELHRSLRVTTVYVTHDQAEAMTMSDLVAVMFDGELLQCGSPREVYEDPATLQVAEFIGSPKINVLPATVRRDGAVEVQGATLPVPTGLPAGTAVHLGIRPGALDLDRPGAPAVQLSGRLVNAEYLGSDLFAHVALQGLAKPIILRLPPDQPTPALGEPVALRVLPTRMLVFDSGGARIRPVTAVVQTPAAQAPAMRQRATAHG